MGLKEDMRQGVFGESGRGKTKAERRRQLRANRSNALRAWLADGAANGAGREFSLEELNTMLARNEAKHAAFLAAEQARFEALDAEVEAGKAAIKAEA